MAEEYPVHATADANINYEHSNMTKHLILEYRDDELEICKPKLKPHKDHFWSKQKLWYVHAKNNKNVEIKLINE